MKANKQTMNPTVKTKWLKALRSGRYEQGSAVLLNRSDPKVDKFCCLGVLCDLHAEETKDEWDEFETYHNHDMFPPDEVLDWAGLEACNPVVDGVQISEHNDGAYGEPPKSFNEIADLIEKEL